MVILCGLPKFFRSVEGATLTNQPGAKVPNETALSPFAS